MWRLLKIILTFVVVFFVVSIIWFVYSFQENDRLKKAEVSVYRAKWDSYEFANYTLKLQTFGMVSWGCKADNSVTIIVENRNIKSKTNIDDPYFNASADYIGCTIDGLFDEADKCKTFCKVQYNTKYGFPERIDAGFIESGWIEVLAFQPNDVMDDP